MFGQAKLGAETHGEFPALLIDVLVFVSDTFLIVILAKGVIECWTEAMKLLVKRPA